MAPSENRDGQAWLGPDNNIQVVAFGSIAPQAPDPNTVNEYAQWLRDGLKFDGSRLTCQFVGVNQIVFSEYIKVGHVFYSKTLLRPGTAIEVRVQYPKALKPIWDGRTARIVGTLRFR